LAIAGHVRGFLYHKLDEAEALQERAMALNPNLPLALVFSGLAQSYRGAHEAALARIARYRELSPLDPHAFLFEMALLVPLYMTVQFARVAETGRRVLLLNPGFTSTHKILLAALGQLDRRDEAREVLARLLALEPDFSVATALARTPLQRPEDLTLYAEGLRRAGVRETTPAEMAAG
jgi:tetratricopeptide (TPR) repeat protein